jgi:hypothetical protein
LSRWLSPESYVTIFNKRLSRSSLTVVGLFLRFALEHRGQRNLQGFLCAEFSIDGDLRHAGYIQNWIDLLKADRRAFFTACSKAQAAADYLRGLALAEPAERAA